MDRPSDQSEPFRMRPWLPSTWPVAPSSINKEFLDTLGIIFHFGMLSEIDNVVADVRERHGNLERCSHVLAIAISCAIDILASFTPIEGGKQIQKRRFENFVREYFPDSFKCHAEGLYGKYRNDLVHSWFLFQVSISSGFEPIIKDANNVTSVGLLTFKDALHESAENFLTAIVGNEELEHSVLVRYKDLRGLATRSLRGNSIRPGALPDTACVPRYI